MADPGTPEPKREQDIDWARARTLIRERLRRQLGGEDPSLDDLTQQASIELLRAVRRDGATSLEGLIAVIARGTAVDEIRRRVRERAGNSHLETNLAGLGLAPGPGRDHSDQDAELLWFLLLQFLQRHDPLGHALAVRYAELGDWRRVAEALGHGYDATRQQWSRCARRFRESLRCDPGPFKDWLDDV